VKNKAATEGGKRRAEHSRRHPSSVVRTRRRRSVCDGLDVIRRRRRSNPPDTTPLVITQFSAAVRHRRTEPGWYFCRKLTITHTPDPIRPTKLSGRRLPSCRPRSSWLTVSRQYDAGHPSYDDVTGRQSICRRRTARLEQPSSCHP